MRRMNEHAERVAQLLKARGVPDKEARTALADVCDIRYQSVKGWFDGTSKTIRAENLAKIAKKWGGNLNWLITGKGEMLSNTANTEASNYTTTKKAPLISWVQAGDWSEAIEHEASEWIDVPEADGNVFWLRVVGDSMTSNHGISAPEGSLIKVDPDMSPHNGSLVVAKLTDSQEATFKKLVIDAGRKYLMPLNTAYAALEVNGGCVIVGVVTEIRIKTI